MGRAEDLFRRLSDGGEPVLDELIADRQSEELFLDFKRSADDGAGARLHDNDRANLAKAISGFGNSEGGVIVWGVDVARHTSQGDVAAAKVALEDPRRFLSRIEGAVSGCTVPPHQNVRNVAIPQPGSTRGFVVTYIAKNQSAPLQCVRPPQFFIRAGSSFVPAPYGVLAGLFGRRPEPNVFHMWTLAPVALEQSRADRPLAAHFSIGFLLANDGPAIARDLYVNAMIIPPGDATQIAVEVSDRANWTGGFAFGTLTSLVSVDGYKLAPKALVQPLVFRCAFAPPFERSLFYRINFGCSGSPVRTIEAAVEPARLEEAFDALRGSAQDRASGNRFIETVMSIQAPDHSVTIDEAYGPGP